MTECKSIWGFGELQKLHVSFYEDNPLLMKLTGSNVTTGETIEFSSNVGSGLVYHSPVPYGSVYLNNAIGSILKANEIIAGEAEIPWTQTRNGLSSGMHKFSDMILYQCDMNKLSEFVSRDELDVYRKAYDDAHKAAVETIKRDRRIDMIEHQMSLDEKYPDGYDESAGYNF
jgi:hypothetical protein